jgi:pimeloyl-ACP methyl ester carboxylesterase
VLFEDLSRDFIVVGWDQRGTGKSYTALDPTSTLTLDRAVEDTIEVTNYLRERFDEPKIYVLGESWGTILGVLAVQRQPELYYAYIGSGQMVNVAETDRRIYHDMLKVAQETGDAELEAQLIAFGEPPFADVPYGNGFMLTHYDLLYKPFTPPQAYIERGSSSGIDQFGIMGSEYNLIEKANVLRGLLDTFTVMYPQIQGVDFRTDATRLEVPVYVLDGQAELAARRDLALEWFEGLDAPGKRLYSFENAAHAVAFEQFEAFHAILVETIVPETYHNP